MRFKTFSIWLGLSVSLPSLSWAASGGACPAPEAIAPMPAVLPTPAEAAANTMTPQASANFAMPASIPASEIAASPALTRIASQGAVLYRLQPEHGLNGVFARSGSQFRVFYLTPDNQAEIGGVMWDAHGQNITRLQVGSIPGAVPTVRWQPKSADEAMPTPMPATAPVGEKVAQADINPVARLQAAHYGLEGRDGAPRVYMIIDPFCPFSTRAFGELAPYAAAGKLQIAIVPVSINDHENGGSSTPAALQLLSADPHAMGDVWRKISNLGHAEPGKAANDLAQANLTLNMAAAHAVKMRGTPTLVWTDRNGQAREEAGVPDNIGKFLASLPS